MRAATLILLLFALGNITGAAVLTAYKIYDTKPLVIQKETKILGKQEFLAQKNLRSPEEIYERVSPGVVTIRSQFFTGGNSSTTQGSGFVIDDQGYIITNMHVILLDPFAVNKTVADKVYVDFPNGSVAEAKVIGSDPNADLALLKIVPEPEVKLVPVPIGDSEKVKPGDPVVAIGAPFGERGSQSFGIVSSTERAIQSLVGNFSINGIIQTDAAINKGNSGGPLLNLDGEVIGINTQIKTDNNQGGNEGIAYAVPSKTLLQLLPRLREGGTLQYPYLGVTTREITPQLKRKFKLPTAGGLLVQQLNDGSPAVLSGIKPPKTSEEFYGENIGLGGDIILALNGEKLEKPEELSDRLMEYQPGEKVTLSLMNPDGKKRDAVVVLGSRT